MLEDKIDTELLREISERESEGAHKRLMNALERWLPSTADPTKDSALVELYDLNRRHRYFPDIIAVPGVGKKTVAVLEEYLFEKGYIEERKLQDYLAAIRARKEAKNNSKLRLVEAS